ncbi:MAG TPA: sigma factor-like helix-turn-helix DNA-binding protein [Candidatus Saccharimonadales bacterium]|nr:sigma factor-like helix-turn-helix DNA-binding protein [Candidatus Saccharimonadales bacterium]
MPPEYGFVTLETLGGEVAARRHALVRFAGSISMNSDPEDPVQLASLDALKHVLNKDLEPLRAGPEFTGFLFTAVRRRTIDEFRWQSSRVKREEKYEADREKITPNEPEQAAMTQGLWEKAVRVIADDERVEIMRLSVNGASHSEIAAQLGVSVGFVKSKIEQAKKSLHKAVQRGWFDGYQ